MCMYVSEICAEGIFVAFPWWLKNVKSRSKIALFSNEHHFEIWFSKKRTITFFWSKLHKLHKKHPILHVATTFFLKQGETRTSHRPIPHPLTYVTVWCFQCIFYDLCVLNNVCAFMNKTQRYHLLWGYLKCNMFHVSCFLVFGGTLYFLISS